MTKASHDSSWRACSLWARPQHGPGCPQTPALSPAPESGVRVQGPGQQTAEPSTIRTRVRTAVSPHPRSPTLPASPSQKCSLYSENLYHTSH